MSNTPNLRYARKRLLYASSLKNRERCGVVNECMTPDLGASREDLAEFHAEELRNRRARQLARTPSSRWRAPSKSNDPEYRKSIWPTAKIERRRAVAS